MGSEMSEDELVRCAHALIASGGSWEKCLGELLLLSDKRNAVKIRAVFKNELEKYL